MDNNRERGGGWKREGGGEGWGLGWGGGKGRELYLNNNKIRGGKIHLLQSLIKTNYRGCAVEPCT